jgi:hypothetical protein
MVSNAANKQRKAAQIKPFFGPVLLAEQGNHGIDFRPKVVV